MSSGPSSGFSVNHTSLLVPDSGVSFPQCERDCLQYWDEIKAFETQLELSKGRPEFTFYDGPPFATGLPHYGHFLAGTIKDIVTRHASQSGFHVERKFGWDCHGLPVEHEVDKILQIKSKDDIMQMGIPKYNDTCRSIVLRYTAEWEKSVKRLGRWIDFQNGYRTMDLKFMESVWWVFKRLYDDPRGLVYRGSKVMPYSIALTTPLSNFEANLNYKEVHDPAVYVTFPIVGDVDKAEFVAWTTTPWTLPSNLALCVNPKMVYVRVRDLKLNRVFVLAKMRMGELYTVPKIAGANMRSAATEEEKAKQAQEEEARVKAEFLRQLPPKTEQYEILKEVTGAELKGLSYVPLFKCFQEAWAATAFKVVSDDYVTDDSGVGVVHCAPAFGEDDHRVCLINGITKKDSVLPCPLDDEGRFTDEVPEFKGLHVKSPVPAAAEKEKDGKEGKDGAPAVPTADPEVIKLLKAQGRLIKSASVMHKYPYCWRSETPLIYRTVPSWFIRVEAIKDKLLASNDQTSWVPSTVKDGRFGNWLRDARDWAVSRSRYWGTPLPIWTSADMTQVIVVGSVAELEQLSGVQGITDIHKDKVDFITIPDPRGASFPPLQRVPDVFDCWFESGSMPYAQLHYPFENKAKFEGGFPADFIGEGLDQTRGWFYTLMVLSTALFEKPAFKNVIVNGMVLASDGKKMSKKLKNYPDPNLVIEAYGADALRLYLINSPVVRAEPLAFKEDGVKAIVKMVMLPWWNAFRFCLENIVRLNEDKASAASSAASSSAAAAAGPAAAAAGWAFEMRPVQAATSSNVMDRWVVSMTNTLLVEVKREMAAYRLYTVVPLLLRFIDQLTNWYVRSNRRRIKMGELDDREQALSTLTWVLLTLCKLMSPLTPFITETMYQHLKLALPAAERVPSVHFLLIPEASPSAINAQVEATVANMQRAVELARSCRTKRDVPLKIPVRKLVVACDVEAVLADVSSLVEYVREEVNVREVVFDTKVGNYVKAEAALNLRNVPGLGRRLGSRIPEVQAAVAKLTMDELESAKKAGKVSPVTGIELQYSELEVQVKLAQSNVSTLELASQSGLVAILDLAPDRELAIEGGAREIVSRVQKLRKAAGLSPQDKIEVFVQMAGAVDPKELPVDEAKLNATLDIPLLARSNNPTIQKALKALGLPAEPALAVGTLHAQMLADAAAAAATKAAADAKAAAAVGDESKSAPAAAAAAAAGKKGGKGAKAEAPAAAAAAPAAADEAKAAGADDDDDDTAAITVQLEEVLAEGGAFIKTALGVPLNHAKPASYATILISDASLFNGVPLKIYIAKPTVYVNTQRAVAAYPADERERVAAGLTNYVISLPAEKLQGGDIKLNIDGKSVTFQFGKDIFLSYAAFTASQ